jgi:hypothetical protein
MLPIFEQHEGLTPDSSRAMGVFLERMALYPKNFASEAPTLPEVCQSEKSFFVPFLLRTRHLPRGTTWLWNQSRNRVSTQRIDGTPGSLLFYKLGTRRGLGVRESAPNYKIWIFNYSDPSVGHLSMVWCERGEPLPSISSTTPLVSSDELSGSVSSDELFLSDYSFLAPFTTEALAREFGWI